ncbi:glycoside hydrolase family 88 protein [Paenibacillus sp. N3/727]|uniref:glycoside hydrolase family 88 protein n=1 Tax=Paenibacillus sp. N3/727 TaxID=2925845 RepID=UPI001F53D658|nr:glycoside hydrolase family 88 protein [Paenibacillus sp. N3/727]UNK17342.1 glycoside hydrolase family 88 protein [Paenibacillus sp. N3/727]
MKQIKDEGIQDASRYDRAPQLTKERCKEAMDFIVGQVDRNLETFEGTFPSEASTNNVYRQVGNTEWTPAFWTGMLWLAYETTGDAKYRLAAENQLGSYKQRVEERRYTDTHDLGFLYTLSCVSAYKLTGNEEAKDLALAAAELLYIRYLDKAGIIQAWGNLSDPRQQGRMIIDCLMNLPLLYWASEVSGEHKYHDAAASHVQMAAQYLIREDASSFHTFYMDTETGEPKYGSTAQGYADGSCWSRGQAWGMYGFPLSYRYTDDFELIELTKKITNYFLNRLPQDYVSYWDLIFTEGEEERDSSAAAIAACGLLETAGHLPLADSLKRLYENAALLILESLIDNYMTRETPESNGILLHAVYSKPGDNGVDECCIWGDYYMYEALVRVTKDWKPYW